MSSDQLILNQNAVSSKSGIMHLSLSSSRAYNYRVSERGGSGTIVVSVTTLDEYCADNNLFQVRVLNLDVEGHDADVIQGAQRLLTSGGVDIIMLEVHFSYQEVYRTIQDLGYTAFYYVHSKLHPKLVKISSLCHSDLRDLRPSPFNRRVIFVRTDLLKEQEFLSLNLIDADRS